MFGLALFASSRRFITKLEQICHALELSAARARIFNFISTIYQHNISLACDISFHIFASISRVCHRRLAPLVRALCEFFSHLSPLWSALNPPYISLFVSSKFLAFSGLYFWPHVRFISDKASSLLLSHAVHVSSDPVDHQGG